MKTEEAPKKTEAKHDLNYDGGVEKELKDAVTRSAGSKIRGLVVSCKEGIARISGEVDEQSQIASITAIAERIKGIKEVENKITFKAGDKATTTFKSGETAPVKKPEAELDVKPSRVAHV